MSSLFRIKPLAWEPQPAEPTWPWVEACWVERVSEKNGWSGLGAIGAIASCQSPFSRDASWAIIARTVRLARVHRA